MQVAVWHNVELHSPVVDESEQTWAIVEKSYPRNRVEAIREAHRNKRGEAGDGVAEDEIYLSNNFYF